MIGAAVDDYPQELDKMEDIAFSQFFKYCSQNIQSYSLSSSSSSSSLLIWKYLSSYASRAEATTRSQSRRLFFFKYFFVRYLRYLFEKGTDEVRTILFFSLARDTSFPKLDVFPSTL